MSLRHQPRLALGSAQPVVTVVVDKLPLVLAFAKRRGTQPLSHQLLISVLNHQVAIDCIDVDLVRGSSNCEAEAPCNAKTMSQDPKPPALTICNHDSRMCSVHRHGSMPALKHFHPPIPPSVKRLP